jgi:hypothetical protein
LQSPLNLLEWAKLYPTLPLRTVALSFAAANNTKRCRNIIGDRTVVVAQLIAERLEEFMARRRSYEPDGPLR